MTLLLGRRLINIGSHWHLMILWPCCFFHENVINALFRDEKKVSQLSLWVVMLSSWKGTYWLPSSHLSFHWRDALQFMRFLHVCVWWLVCVCVLTREKHFTSIFTSIFKGGQVLTKLFLCFWSPKNSCSPLICRRKPCDPCDHSKWTKKRGRHEAATRESLRDFFFKIFEANHHSFVFLWSLCFAPLLLMLKEHLHIQ
jgi:hypothetical protein